MGYIATRPVSVEDLAGVLAAGIFDFRAAPLLSVAIASLYTVGGWLLIALVVRLKLPYLVYPLAMGFALIAPFVAVAFYEVSRSLEQGLTPTLASVWHAVWKARGQELRWMALLTSFAFFIWIDIAAMLTLSFFGATALDIEALVRAMVSSHDGLIFLLVGNIVGAAIALLVFSISVVSFPLLYDRNVDVFTAIATSLRLVRTSPVTMAAWCAMIALMIGIAILSAFVLLPIVLPVVGYASWHLYRQVVADPSAVG